jgi:peptidoglycan/xylan/chitin deacetylase (PgdA/CDA1 family)
MAGNRVPGSINQRSIDGGTSILSFSPLQGPTGAAFDTYHPDIAQARAKDGSPAGEPAKALPGAEIRLQITIDDAPGGSKTNDAMLDLLEKFEIKTMFFVMGTNVQARPKDCLKILDRGHRLGNHTWDHPQLTRLKDADIESQLKRTDELVKKLTGKSMAPHWRPPYGDGHNDARVLRAAAAVGFSKMWYWDIDTEDWKILTGPVKHQVVRPQADVTKLITGNMEGQLKVLRAHPRTGREGETGKYVVLCHDKPTTVAALAVLLPQLKSEGYRFVDFP